MPHVLVGEARIDVRQQADGVQNVAHRGLYAVGGDGDGVAAVLQLLEQLRDLRHGLQLLANEHVRQLLLPMPDGLVQLERQALGERHEAQLLVCGEPVVDRFVLNAADQVLRPCRLLDGGIQRLVVKVARIHQHAIEVENDELHDFSRRRRHERAAERAHLVAADAKQIFAHQAQRVAEHDGDGALPKQRLVRVNPGQRARRERVVVGVVPEAVNARVGADDAQRSAVLAVHPQPSLQQELVCDLVLRLIVAQEPLLRVLLEPRVALHVKAGGERKLKVRRLILLRLVGALQGAAVRDETQRLRRPRVWRGPRGALRRQPRASVLGQEARQVLGHAQAPHSVAEGHGVLLALRGADVVDGRDVKLAVHLEVVRHHFIRRADEVAPALPVVEADRRVLADDHLLLDVRDVARGVQLGV